jgi:hypothetical protein
MNARHAISDKNAQKVLTLTSIESTLGYWKAGHSLQQMPELAFDSIEERNVSGQVLATHDGAEQPVIDACVELYAVSPLKVVANSLPKAVLDHCRTLLLGKAKPIDLYPCGGHVADMPLVSFADIQQLCEIPGYELLAAAAKSQPDTSFKRLLSSNPAILRPLLCYYHPASFPAVHVASAFTDTAGFFRSTVLDSCNADEQFGYLFIIRNRISKSIYTTLYNPSPATWYTHWNWSNDKSVTLRTRHPLALCEPVLK